MFLWKKINIVCVGVYIVQDEFFFLSRFVLKMSNLPTTFLTHSQRVCRLYKSLFALARREEWPDRLNRRIFLSPVGKWGFAIFRLAYRQRMVEYRARFDTNKNVQDLMKAKRLLIAGEEELQKAMYWHTENFNCKSLLLTTGFRRKNLFFFSSGFTLWYCG